MVPVSQQFGDQDQLYQRIINNIGFGIHVSLPCIVQKYDNETETIEAQPTVRERVIKPDGKIVYMDYPILINVPVMFPRAGNFLFKFPINQGDECLVVFSDLSIDNWYLFGNVQNPVEQRRHDLSDGIAVFGLASQDALKKKREGDTTANGKYIPAADELYIGDITHGMGFRINGTQFDMALWMDYWQGATLAWRREWINLHDFYRLVVPRPPKPGGT